VYSMVRCFLTALAIMVLVASTACSRVAPHVVATVPAPEPVVRISQGFFPPALLPEVRARLEDGRASLEPALRALPGLLHYYVAIDSVSSSIVNVSIWESLEAALRMNTLHAMLAQRDLFIEAGVEFQPIRNYTGLWSIAP